MFSGWAVEILRIVLWLLLLVKRISGESMPSIRKSGMVSTIASWSAKKGISGAGVIEAVGVILGVRVIVGVSVAVAVSVGVKVAVGGAVSVLVGTTVVAMASVGSLLGAMLTGVSVTETMLQPVRLKMTIIPVMAFHIGECSPRILWKNVPKDSTVAL